MTRRQRYQQARAMKAATNFATPDDRDDDDDFRPMGTYGDSHDDGHDPDSCSDCTDDRGE
jgi:hypothetical protein